MNVSGVLNKMAVSFDHGMVSYELRVGESQTPLADLIGHGLRIEYSDQILCAHCGNPTSRSYSGGYCYQCFKTLAQTDLCIVRPDRCHYALGTCREPEWADGFCMQTHVVYLACSSGPKVGLTREGQQLTRWIDQGACKAVPVYRAQTRHLAGVVEVMLTQHMSDRTDWRKMLTESGESVDLEAIKRRVTNLVNLPEGVTGFDAEPVAFTYPGEPEKLPTRSLNNRFVLSGQTPVVEGRLMAIKGQFLIFEHGVFNVRQHRSYNVNVQLVADDLLNVTPEADTQMELF
ncbi:MAG: DUF2797 domain-containing protein [Proteobacteria bacterium]|nr:DUF2797 domain-containing protein [Pseudomonadota bacterium]